MITFVYDGSLCGLLTCIFEIYERKASLCSIVKNENSMPDVFSQEFTVVSDAVKAERVWKGLQGKLSVSGLHNIYACYLSELARIENVIVEHIKHVFANKRNVEKDFGHAATLQVSQHARKVFREKHRMEAFVRFKRSADNIYYAVVDPDYNVLPLIASHFKDRYADQHWIIQDVRRKYALYFDKGEQAVREVTLDNKKGASFPMTPFEIFAEDEPAYQALWKEYFRSVDIPSRRNLKLHVQHVPVRYWKFLTEKH